MSLHNLADAIEEEIRETVSERIDAERFQLERQFAKVINEHAEQSKLIAELGLPDYPLMHCQKQMIARAIEMILSGELDV
ncbi:MAG: hypothetical protein AAFN66_05375 [Pseudomonadota bacterium]